MLVQPQPQTQADSSQLNHGELRGLEELLSVCAEYEKQLDSERCPRTSPSSHGNRIKTNGSLPRDKPSSPDVPFRECSVGVNGASESMNGNTSPAMRHHPNSFSLPRLKNHSEGIPSPPEGGTSPRNKIRTNLFCYDKRGVGAASSPGLGSASLNGKLLDRSDPNSVNGSLSSVPDSFGTTSVDGFTTASFSRVQLMATVMNGNHGSAPVQETKGFASVSNPPRPPACTVTSVHGNFPFASNNTPCVSSTTVLSLAVINSSSSSYHRNQTFLTSDPQQFYPPVPAAPLVSSESESSVSSPSPANSVKRAVPPTSQGTAGDRTSTTSSREELLRTAASLKARIQQIEKKATEVVQEVEVERALLLAELSEEREVLSREEQKLLALQKREEREREEMIRKRKEVEDTWKRMEAAEAAARKERDAVSNSPEEDEERQRKIRQFEEVADVERRTFEDLEFHLLETEAVRETEREEAAREAKLLEERSQARRWEVAALIRQQTEMVRAARKETAALENERRQLISEVDQIMERLSLDGLSATSASSSSSLRMRSSQVPGPETSVPRSEEIPTSPKNCPEGARSEPDGEVRHSQEVPSSGDPDESFRPLSEASSLDVDLTRFRENPKRAQRPLTQFLPFRDSTLNLRNHIESSGHPLDLCDAYVHLTESTCKGYLQKLGSRFRTWNKRWFVFDRRKKTLTYYGDKNEKKLRGGAYFQDIEEVYVDHQNKVKSPHPRLTFCIKTLERSYYLMAPTIEVMRIWVDVVFTGAEGYQEYAT